LFLTKLANKETEAENMKKPVIFILEGENDFNQDLQKHLSQQGFEVIVSFRNSEFLPLFQKAKPDLAIIGSHQNSAWEVLKVAGWIRRQNPTTPLILLVNESSEAQAIAALRVGVNDYFKQPVSPAELLASIRRHLPGSLGKALTNKPASQETETRRDLIGETPCMRKLKEYIIRAAAIDCNVLITGETGTGKERVADLIHQRSSRQGKPMVYINCAALPENLLESELFGYERGAFTGASWSNPGKLRLAEGGTVFLDEVFEMSSYMQAKILRVIDTRGFYSLGGKKQISLNIRIVAATNQNLERSLEQGTFRKDLFFRLNVARIHLPPLRERQADIPLLLEHYLQEMNRRFGRQVEGFTPEVMELLLGYYWPGNIRELKNLVEALFINLPSKRISLVDLPESFQRLRENLERPSGERERVLMALLGTDWNKSKAAQKLHWSRRTLYRKLEKYEIHSSKVINQR
jgi:DNA-binding NtrC family response regulator